MCAVAWLTPADVISCWCRSCYALGQTLTHKELCAEENVPTPIPGGPILDTGSVTRPIALCPNQAKVLPKLGPPALKMRTPLFAPWLCHLHLIFEYYVGTVCRLLLLWQGKWSCQNCFWLLHLKNPKIKIRKQNPRRNTYKCWCC